MDSHSEPITAGGKAAGAGATGPPLLAHLDRLMEELHAQTPKALHDFDEEGIHRARVATRRLSAALDLVKPVVGKKRRKALARVLRRLRRRLGPLRDADVMLGHLQALRAEGTRHAAAIDWMAGRLSEERAGLRQKSAILGGAAQVLAELAAWHPVRDQIAAAGERLDLLVAESLHLQLDAFVEQAARVVEEREKNVERRDRHDPHELRIAGKALRYTLEMAVAQGHALPAAVMKTFKRMQELLGAWHDFVVLAEKAMHASLEAMLSHYDAAAQDKVFGLAQRVVRRSSRQLDQFCKVWKAGGGRLAETIRASFPLTVSSPPAPVAPTPADRVIEPKTDPGPRGSAEAAVPAASAPGAPSDAS